MSDESGRHIVCPHCGSINRIPAGKPAARGKCGSCRRALFTGHPIEATGASLARHLRHDDIPVLVDFWAEWCGPCKAMAPAYERAAAEFEPDIRFLKLNTEAEPEPAARYGIRGIPTLILFRKGTIVDQNVGAVDGARLRAWLSSHLPRG